MKTKIFGGIAIVAIALAVAFNVSLNTGKTNNASLLALANVEALASEGVTVTCGKTGGACWKETYRMKYCKEYTYYECERSDDPKNSCNVPC